MTELAFNFLRWLGLHGALVWWFPCVNGTNFFGLGHILKLLSSIFICTANINTLVKRKFGFNEKLFACTVLFDSYNNSVSNHPILHISKVTRFSKCT